MRNNFFFDVLIKSIYFIYLEISLKYLGNMDNRK